MIFNPVRRRIVSAARGAFRTRAQWDYAEVRPIPLVLFSRILAGSSLRITTDCSGLATCCYFHAGAPDPNGQHYDTRQTMFTGTMLAHLPHIPLSAARPGDLAVFGQFPGKHVVVILERGSDPDCASHGGQGDPKIAPLSHFIGIGELTVLQGVPKGFGVRRVLKRKWRVYGDGGKLIGHVRSTRWLWQTRHHRLVAQQRENLRFRRIHH